MKTVMSGIPVERYAVARSPHGTDIAVRGLSAKGISRTACAAGTFMSFPLRRTTPPFGIDSIDVFNVPGLERPCGAKANSSFVAVGSFCLSSAARQSLGTTSNPVPGRSTTPRSRASWSRPSTASKTSTSPVTSR